MRTMERSLGQRIKQVRSDRKLNQAELARILQKPTSWVRRLESGEREPRAGDLAALAAALDTSLDYLVHGIAPRRKPDERLRALVIELEQLPDEPRAYVADVLEAVLRAQGAVELLEKERRRTAALKAPNRTRGKKAGRA